jgi:hypothetical protein
MSDQAAHKTTEADLRMLSPVALAAGLRGLAEHRDAGNLSPMEAALLTAAATYIAGATDSLREHMAMIRMAREETAAVRKMSVSIEDLARKLGFYEGRDRAVTVCLRKAQASEEDDLTPIEEAIREQLIFASREIREMQPKGKGTEA